jgi:hypothetical protein
MLLFLVSFVRGLEIHHLRTVPVFVPMTCYKKFGHSDLSQICDITSVLFLGYGYSNYYGADVGK